MVTSVRTICNPTKLDWEQAKPLTLARCYEVVGREGGDVTLRDIDIIGAPTREVSRADLARIYVQADIGRAGEFWSRPIPDQKALGFVAQRNTLMKGPSSDFSFATGSAVVFCAAHTTEQARVIQPGRFVAIDPAPLPST